MRNTRQMTSISHFIFSASANMFSINTSEPLVGSFMKMRVTAHASFPVCKWVNMTRLLEIG